MIPACNNKTFLVTAQDVKTLTAITLLNIPEKNFTYVLIYNNLMC